MKFSRKKLALVLLALGTMLAMSGTALAQVDSAPMPITLNATLTESLTLTLSASTVNFALVPGSATNAGLPGITATTDWVLVPGRTLSVYAYFTGVNALTSGTNNIPNTAFYINNNGTGMAPLTTVTTWGPGLEMEHIAITAANPTGTATDAMTFNIDLSTGTLPTLPAGTYTGTLNIRAYAI